MTFASRVFAVRLRKHVRVETRIEFRGKVDHLRQVHSSIRRYINLLRERTRICICNIQYSLVRTCTRTQFLRLASF